MLFSGGGFSNYWPRPAYQDAVVGKFINSLNGTNDGLYNKSGRGYPDVSAFAQNFEIVINGEVDYISGTSASAPTFASVVSLLNDRLLTAGKSPLGLLEPVVVLDRCVCVERRDCG